MRRILFALILILTWCSIGLTKAQVQDSTQLVSVLPDPMPMPLNNQGDFEGINERYNSPEFNYTEVSPNFTPQSTNINMSWIGYIINGLVSYILPILLVFLAIVGLYKLYLYLQGKDPNALRRKQKDSFTSSEDIIENIHEVDFAKHIENALKNKSYNLAIRWSYLYNLKIMDDKKIIEWKPKKTNKDYYYEISKNQLKKDFKYLTYIYDYLWFGKFEIEKKEAEQILIKFEDFKLILNKV